MTSRIAVLTRSWERERDFQTQDPGAQTIEESHLAWFTPYYEEKWASVFRYLDRLSGDPEMAADIAQEAFLRLLRRGSPPDDPMPWLVTVAHNLLRDRQRKSRRRLRLLAGRPGRAAVGDPPRAPDEAAEGREDGARVRAALSKLPERSRRILLLRAEGLSYREIAAVAGVRETSVGSLLLRATEALKRTMEASGVSSD